MKRSIVVAAVAFLVVLLAGAGDTLAGRKSTAEMEVAPSPCALPGVYDVTASGFNPGSRVAVNLSRRCDSGVTYNSLIWVGYADASGSISLSRPTESWTGTYVLDATQLATKGRGKRATVSFAVE